jgi:hypothetical protein
MNYDMISNKINLAYKINSGSTINFMKNRDIDSYTLNIIILFISSIYILYLYVKSHITIDMKFWNIMKCHPKYLFFSGFIQKEPGLSAIETTMNNFGTCTTKFAKEVNNEVLNETLKVDSEKLYQNASNMINNRQIKNDDYSDSMQQFIDISNNLNNTLTDKQKLIEKSLASSGIYIDYYNKIVSYFKEYIRNYMTYVIISYTRLYHKARQEQDYEKSQEYLKTIITIRNLLQKHFGGNNL